MTPADNLKFTQDALARNPDLTKDHFARVCGFGLKTCNKWEESGLVTFGKAKKQKNLTFSSGKKSTTTTLGAAK